MNQNMFVFDVLLNPIDIMTGDSDAFVGGKRRCLSLSKSFGFCSRTWFTWVNLKPF